MGRWNRTACWLLLTNLVVVGGLLSACATQVDISGRFPARNPAAGELRKLTIVPFGGPGGAAFTATLEADLVAAAFDGERYFTIVDGDGRGQVGDAARYGRGLGVDGVLLGQASQSVRGESIQTTQTKCVERSGDKCKRFDQVKVWCSRRIAEVTVDARLVQTSTGKVVYSTSRTETDQTSWCPGETPSQNDESLALVARNKISTEIRRDIAPYHMVLQATVKESSKGLPKPLAGQFALAVKAAKAANLSEACRLWNVIAVAAPDHVWTAYNLGVCAESSGDYATALKHYQNAQMLGASGDRLTTEAINRVSNLLSAQRQLLAEREKQARAAEAERTKAEAEAEAKKAADAKKQPKAAAGKKPRRPAVKPPPPAGPEAAPQGAAGCAARPSDRVSDFRTANCRGYDLSAGPSSAGRTFNGEETVGNFGDMDLRLPDRVICQRSRDKGSIVIGCVCCVCLGPPRRPTWQRRGRTTDHKLSERDAV